MSRGVRKSGGTKKKFLWKWNLKRGVLLWDTLSTDDFILFYFILFFQVYFSFSFLFILKDDEEAHDNEVT